MKSITGFGRSQKIKRGHVDIFINRKYSETSQQIHFNEELAKNWLNGFHGIAKRLKLEPVKNAQVLLQIPDFIRSENEVSLKPGEKVTLFKTIDQTLRGAMTFMRNTRDMSDYK